MSVAAVTAIYSVICAVGMFHATGWDALAWLVWGFYGNWSGAGVGFLLGLVGCVQRTRRRARAARAMCVNVLVVFTPLLALLVPIWLAQP